MVPQNILLLDSELLNRDLLGNHLRHAGFKVFACENCAEAGKLIPQKKIRLAIINSRFGEKAIKGIIGLLHSFEIDALVFLLSQQIPDADSLARMKVHDTIIKPYRLEEVGLKLKHAQELSALREAVRTCTERIRKLEDELKGYRSVEDQVKIPDLATVEVTAEDAFPSGNSQIDRNKKLSAAEQDPVTDEVPPEGSAAGEADVFTQIRKLDELKKAGILTDSEFNHKKKELLKRI